MIGVIVHSEEHPTVEEFFELFKTPWEFYQPGRNYKAVLRTTGDSVDIPNAALILEYGARSYGWETGLGFNLSAQSVDKGVLLGQTLPFYHGCRNIGKGRDFGNASVAESIQTKGRTVYRIGYDLFAEVRHLLREGQPVDNALSPTLDLHIDALRRLLLESGIAVVEIPPVPAGHRFFGCLTHDIDFVSLRQHLFDHTLGGFLYRATLGSAVDWVKGYRSLPKVIQNFAAVLRLPFVYTGLADDFWMPFERYIRTENGRPSTFFVVPYKRTPGEPLTAVDNRRRATQYDIGDVTDRVSPVEQNGGEIALHGLDAWCNVSKARREADRFPECGASRPRGVRMHWLYFAENSPKILDDAGFDYDSTSGFNDAVGYKAGTSQVFRPEGVRNLLELPMHIQDTALFYPGRMHLKEKQAWDLCSRLVGNAQEHGGVLTLLWHDRSLVPERLWGEFYSRLMTDLDSRGVFWATAQQVTDWFRARRGLGFGKCGYDENEITISFNKAPATMTPDFLVRISWKSPDGSVRKVEVPVKGRSDLSIELNTKPRSKTPIENSLSSRPKSEATALAV